MPAPIVDLYEKDIYVETSAKECFRLRAAAIIIENDCVLFAPKHFTHLLTKSSHKGRFFIGGSGGTDLISFGRTGAHTLSLSRRSSARLSLVVKPTFCVFESQNHYPQ